MLPCTPKPEHIYLEVSPIELNRTYSQINACRISELLLIACHFGNLPHKEFQVALNLVLQEASLTQEVEHIHTTAFPYDTELSGLCCRDLQSCEYFGMHQGCLSLSQKPLLSQNAFRHQEIHKTMLLHQNPSNM